MIVEDSRSLLRFGPIRSASPPDDVTLLIIDDEISETDALVRLLFHSGFKVECAHTGADGLACALSLRPKAIVLDLHLPDLLGLTVLSELRRARLAAAVLVLTGWYQDAGHEQAAAALGAFAFFHKPVDVDELAAAVRVGIEHTDACLQSYGKSVAPPATSQRDQAAPRPTFETHRRLHERILAGDGSASEELFTALLHDLASALRRKYRVAAADWIHDAVVDALLDYRATPHKYDQTRGTPLVTYLFCPAERNLINRLDSERRRSQHETTVVAVESLPCESAASVDQETSIAARLMLSAASREFTAAERAVLHLSLAGERRSSAFEKR